MTPSATSFRRRTLWGTAIVAVIVIAFFNARTGAFVFDDDAAIVQNLSLRHLQSPGAVLRTPDDGSPATGRPLTNLSFALNFAVSGLSPSGYHAVNLAIHVGAALLLFGIIRRTLEPARAGIPTWISNHAGPVSAAAAALWAVHPLQTESVTYVAQRSEELMGLCYLAALYGFVRATARGPARTTAWLWVSAACCLFGTAAKEVIVTAPVVILLYDRTFVAGTLRAALRTRRFYYAALAATWVPLALLLMHSGSRGGTIGFGSGISGWRYLESQVPALAHYLRLCFWPHPLVIDYGSRAVPIGPSFIAGFLIAATGIVWTMVGMARNTAASFLGVWFFAILAPTSSVVPVASEVMAEHRLYLSLAALVMAVVVAAGQLLRSAVWPVLLSALVACVFVTRERNRDYRTPLDLWTQTVSAQPDNAGAHNNRGAALLALHRPAEAETEYRAAVALDPGMAGAHNNLGAVLLLSGRDAAAVKEFAQAVRLHPAYAEARLGLAEALARVGHGGEALDEYEQALRDGADPAKVSRGKAMVQLQTGRGPEALAGLRSYAAAHPNDPDGHVDLGFGLEKGGDVAGAEAEYRAALRLDPASGDGAANLGNLLVHEGRLEDGMEFLRAAHRLEPERADVLGNLGGALIATGRPAEGLDACEQALRQQPGLIEAEINRGNAFARLRRYPEAISAYREVLREHPDYALAHHNLAAVLHLSGDDAGARAELAAEQRARVAQP